MDIPINNLLLKSSLTEEEVLGILGISKNELEKLCYSGKIARFKFGNPNRIEYMPSSITRYIKDNIE